VAPTHATKNKCIEMDECMGVSFYSFTSNTTGVFAGPDFPILTSFALVTPRQIQQAKPTPMHRAACSHDSNPNPCRKL